MLMACPVTTLHALLPGPGNQPFLHEVGTPGMLLWHDREPGSGGGGPE